jgi:hypothetical protein
MVEHTHTHTHAQNHADTSDHTTSCLKFLALTNIFIEYLDDVTWWITHIPETWNTWYSSHLVFFNCICSLFNNTANN